MKKILYAFMAAAALGASLSSCSDNITKYMEPGDHVLELSIASAALGEGNTLRLGGAPETVTVTVNSNTKWQVTETSNGSFIEVRDIESDFAAHTGKFTIAVRENTSGAEREGYVDVFITNAQNTQVSGDEGGKSIRIKVTQDFSNVRLSPNALAAFPAVKNPESDNPQVRDLYADMSVEITGEGSKVKWDMTISYGGTDQSFINIEPMEGTMEQVSANEWKGEGQADFRLRLDENRTTLPREAVISLTSDNGNYRLTVNQLGSDSDFAVNALSESVEAAGRDVTFMLYSPNSDWTVSSPQAGDTPQDWLEILTPSGKKNNERVEVTVRVKRNLTKAQRTANIRIQPTESNISPLMVNVIQSAADAWLQINGQTVFTPQGEGGEISFDLVASHEWRIVDVPQWIHMNAEGGPAGDNIPVSGKVEPNGTGEYRQALMRIVSTERPDLQSIEIKVMQRAISAVFYLRQAATWGSIVEADGGSKLFSLTSDFEWTIETPDWVRCDISGDAPSSLSQFMLTVDANSSFESREGKVVLKPLPTDISGVLVDPYKCGLDSISIGITQMGTFAKLPVVSYPWLTSIGQETAEVMCSFQSVEYPVTSGSIYYRVKDASNGPEDNWMEERVNVNSLHSGTISITLTDLRGDTDYEMYGGVDYDTPDGGRGIGGAQSEFHTAGQRPGPDDNPTPGN